MINITFTGYVLGDFLIIFGLLMAWTIILLIIGKVPIVWTIPFIIGIPLLIMFGILGFNQMANELALYGEKFIRYGVGIVILIALANKIGFDIKNYRKNKLAGNCLEVRK